MQIQHAEEQAALRRVAMLVAREVAPQKVLDAIVVEGSRLLGGAPVTIVRYGERDGQAIATVLATHRGNAPVGMEWSAEGETGTGQVRRTGRPWRTDSFEGTSLAETARRLGVAAAVSAPIVVEGEVWGALTTQSSEGPLPRGTEWRLAEVAELLAAAITGLDARRQLHSLAEEQSALRRVAEIVAGGAAETELFQAVVAEASKLVGDEATTLLRFDPGGMATVIATRDGPAPVGARFAVSADDESIPGRVLRTGRPARQDDYAGVDGPAYVHRFGVASSVAAPILLEGRVWGIIGATTPATRPLPAGAESRLQQFADLVAVALGNAQARAEVQTLAEEQAALRRVAEHVARGDPPDTVFEAVAHEASVLIGDEAVTLSRFESSSELVVVARARGPVSRGTRIAFDPDTLPDRVLRGAAITRVDDYTRERDAELAAAYGIVAAVAAPVVVDGRPWGMLTATSPVGALRPDTGHRLEQFAQLVGFAIGNAENRAKLTASRARVIATADEARRRLQRDVHDGAQQRLVQTVIALKLARHALAAGDAAVPRLLEEGLYHAERATTELRDVVRGIMPASLSSGGLRAGVESLVDDLPLPVEVDVRVPRLASQTETTAYFIVAEALTNVVKHAGASRAVVHARVTDRRLELAVRDDGAGGAHPAGGTGLTGLADRVEACDGTLSIDSPAGAGTALCASLPFDLPDVTPAVAPDHPNA